MLLSMEALCETFFFLYSSLTEGLLCPRMHGLELETPGGAKSKDTDVQMVTELLTMDHGICREL